MEAVMMNGKIVNPAKALERRFIYRLISIHVSWLYKVRSFQ